MKRWVMAVSLVLCAACSPAPAPPPEPPPAPAAANTPSLAAAPARDLPAATMRVIGLDGAPLAGMAPVTTSTANAFEPPVSSGSLTNSAGETRFYLPANQKLFVRAWDPNLRYFANNFYEIDTAEAEARFEFEVTMVEGGTFTASFFRADGSAIADTEVQMLMLHPTRGPWWPARARTDSAGNAAFSKVPAGEFVLEVRAPEGLKRELPQTPLRPGGTADLGQVVLQP